MKSLREEVELLKEFMNASSYPGPSPGQLYDLKVTYSQAARAMMFPELYANTDRKKFKDRNAKKRATLEKLAIWAQQKEKS